MHAVRSLVVGVTLADRIEVWYKPNRSASLHQPPAGERRGSTLRRGRLQLSVVGAAGLETEDNLCLRAARWWMARFGEPNGHLEIVLHKEIPIAVGLGGGSSDAAALLRALGRLGQQTLDSLDSEDVVALGSDVPFCLAGRPALVTGIGEQIEYRRVSVSAMCLVLPDWSWPTVEAYRALDALRHGKNVAEGFGEEPPLGWNDFWPLARQRQPGLHHLRRLLKETGASSIGMSGKGPLLFGTYATLTQARRAAALLEGHGFWARAVEVIQGPASRDPGLEGGPRQ